MSEALLCGNTSVTVFDNAGQQQAATPAVVLCKACVAATLNVGDALLADHQQGDKPWSNNLYGAAAGCKSNGKDGQACLQAAIEGIAFRVHEVRFGFQIQSILKADVSTICSGCMCLECQNCKKLLSRLLLGAGRSMT